MSDYQNINKIRYNLRVLRYYPGTDYWFDIWNRNKHAVDLVDEAVKWFDIGINYIDDPDLQSKVQTIRDQLAKSKTSKTPFDEYFAAYQAVRALSREDERLLLTK